MGFSVLGLGIKGFLPKGDRTSSGENLEQGRIDGTSFATPIVAGIVSLLLQYLRASGYGQPHYTLKLQTFGMLRRISGAHVPGEYRYLAPWEIVDSKLAKIDFLIAIKEAASTIPGLAYLDETKMFRKRFGDPGRPNSRP